MNVCKLLATLGNFDVLVETIFCLWKDTPRYRPELTVILNWIAAGKYCRLVNKEHVNCDSYIAYSAGRRFYRLQLYTVITLHTQLNTAQPYMVTTRHHTTLHIHNSIQHNSIRHNSTPTTQHDTTRHTTTLHGHNSTRHNSTQTTWP